MNKKKTCKDCKDRFVGCHGTCTYYIERSKRHEKRREERYAQFELIYDPLLYDRKIKKMSKRLSGWG